MHEIKLGLSQGLGLFLVLSETTVEYLHQVCGGLVREFPKRRDNGVRARLNKGIDNVVYAFRRS